MNTIHINLDKPCKRCGQPGACNGGVCLRCAATLLQAGTYRVARSVYQKDAADRALERRVLSRVSVVRRKEPSRIRSSGKVVN